MLRRKVLQYLTNWKKTKEKKCLVVQGARQVGKTFIIEQYAHDNYKEVLEINFKETPNASEIFSIIQIQQ